MTKTELKELCEALAVCVDRDVNTNNGWGFGGAHKTVYHLSNGHSVHIGTAYFRHLKPQPFANIRNERGVIVEPEGVKNVADMLNSAMAKGEIKKNEAVKV